MQVQWTAFLALALLAVAQAQTQGPIKPEAPSQNSCSANQKCHTCLRTPTCAWCSQPTFNAPDGSPLPRCYQPNMHTRGTSPHQQCKTEYVVIDANNRKTLKDESFRQASLHQEAIQIKPQHVKLRLRVNEAYKLHFEYSQAQNYPVDLYYLMDLSKSMEDDKEKLSSLGDLLAQTMQNITTDFRLGFGSFVDKVVMPYVSTVPKKLKEPCDGCKAPYGYRNHMSLSLDTSRFAGEVHNAAVSGNLDAPEGGFDAIMQAIVCRNNIGWRDKARRLLVFSTDASFHYAGDGKLGGIVKPNDGSCHMLNNMYTHSTIQDYPSVAQVNQKVKENGINLIFAVTEGQINIYDFLKDSVEGASAGKLSDDSSNVVDLVLEQYNKITSTVDMKDNASSAVKVTYFSSCRGKGPQKQTHKCDGFKVGDVIKFTAQIEVTKCPENPKDWKQSIEIKPIAINESLIVDLEMICDCPCERAGSPGYKPRALECNSFGSLQCGVCSCIEGHFGRHCECNTSHFGGEQSLTDGCRPDNTTEALCSNRGICECGVCQCYPRANPEEKVTGQYCQCDDFSCSRYQGLICGGEERGTCVCGKCQCKKDWTGAACDCQLSDDTCIASEDDLVCSGKGRCNCGVCECDDTDEGRYSGRYCQLCPTCKEQCDNLRECVHCQEFETDANEDCSKCTDFTPVQVDVVKENDATWQVCSYIDDDGCRYTFAYQDIPGRNLTVEVQKTKECPPEINILGIVLGVIAAIVLIGLAFLLLWKVLTTIHDRREFAKFEKERQMAKWDTGENPIYKQATSTFKNPTYGGK